MATVKGTADEFSGQAAIISKEAEKNVLDTGGIDRVMFSTLPSDLAQQSTFQDWKSCMHAVGCNHRYVDDSIGAGSIIAYGYNSQNPQKMVSRLLIHPYTNDKGEVAYKVNDRIYGQENLGFRQTVDEVVAEKWNKGKKGVFTMASGLYDDNHTGDNIMTLVKANSGEAINLADFAVGNKVRLDECDLSGHQLIIPANIKELDLSYCSGVDLKDVDLSGLESLKLPKDFKNLDKAKFPASLKLLDLSTYSGSELKNMDLSAISSVENLKLPENIEKLESFKLPSSVKNLDLSLCSKLDLKNADLSGVENLKLPDIKSLEGFKLPSSVKTLDLSDCAFIDFQACNLPDVESLKLPGTFRNLDDLKIPPSLKTLDLSSCYDLDLKGADLSAVEDLKLPNNIKSLEGCKLPETLDLTESFSSFANADLGKHGVKEIIIGNEIKNADLTSVDKVHFSKDYVEGKNVKFSGKLDFSDKMCTLSNCDLSKVDELVLPENTFKNEADFEQMLTSKYNAEDFSDEAKLKQILAENKAAVITPDCKLDGIKKIDASKCKNFDLTQFNCKNLQELKLPAGYDVSKIPAEALENPAVAKAVSEVKAGAKAAEQTVAKTVSDAELATGAKSTAATPENNIETSAKRMEERIAERNAADKVQTSENVHSEQKAENVSEQTTNKVTATEPAAKTASDAAEKEVKSAAEDSSERMAERMAAKNAAREVVSPENGAAGKVINANNKFDSFMDKANAKLNDNALGRGLDKVNNWAPKNATAAKIYNKTAGKVGMVPAGAAAAGAILAYEQYKETGDIKEAAETFGKSMKAPIVQAVAMSGGAKVAAKATEKVVAHHVEKKVLKRAAQETAQKTAQKTTQKVVRKAAKKAATKAVAKAAGKTAGKAAAKSLLKKIPGVSAVAGIGFGIGRLKDGDWKGALGEVASGVCGCVPGVGTLASTAMDVGLAARDVSKSVDEEKQKQAEQSKQATREQMKKDGQTAKKTLANNRQAAQRGKQQQTAANTNDSRQTKSAVRQTKLTAQQIAALRQKQNA